MRVMCDFVIHGDVFQKSKMRVAMGGDDSCAAFARLWRIGQLGGAEGQGLACGAVQHNGLGADAGNAHFGHRPGVSPAPGFDVFARGNGLREGALQQHL